MKTKSKWLLLAALISALVCAFGGFAFSAFASEGSVNGWVATAPEGAAANYGSNLAWPQTPTTDSDGFTTWCFNNGQTVANETELDVTKPILITYSTMSNVAPDAGNFVMFALTTTFDGATKLPTGFQEGDASVRPFFYSHHMRDNREYIGIAGEPMKILDKKVYNRLENKCGEAYNAGKTTTLEIYFGATKGSQGYILVDGMHVGNPTVARTVFTDGKAFLAVSAWHSGFFRIKVENKDKATNVKKYRIMDSVDGAKIVLQNNKLWRANAGERVSFTVEDIKAGYCVGSVKAGDAELTAVDGVYSFEMPAAHTTIAVELTAIPDSYKVKSSAKYAKITFADGTDTYEKGANVSFSVKLNGAYALNSVKIGEEELTAVDGVYSFVMPANDVTIIVDATKKYSKPSDNVVDKAVNGWNTEIVTASDGSQWGPLSDINGSTMVDETEGYSNFVFNNAGSNTSVVGFDVSKPIYLDLLVKPNGDIPGPIGWFIMGLYDDWDILPEAGVDAYGGNQGKPELNEKIREYLKLRLGFMYNDINSEKGFLSSGVVKETDFTLTNKFGDAWNWSDDKRTTDFDYAKVEFFIGEEAADGYIKIDGVKVATPTVKRSDFHDGIAYLHLMSFYSSRVQVKAYAPAELDATNVDSRATIVYADGTDLESLNTYDKVTFKVNVPENYGALVVVDGNEIHPDENGNYTAVMGYGKSVLSVSVDEMVKVSFDMGGYGSLDAVTITKGGTISEPEVTREGYTLKWYADAAFETEFDFDASITANCAVYAKWTPVEYGISYYDGANRIRDLMPNAYNAETETFTLPTPVKEGYVFDGWYADAAYTGKAITKVEKGSTGNMTVYAKFSKKTASAASSGCFSTIGADFAVCFAMLAVVSGAWIVLKRRNAR